MSSDKPVDTNNVFPPVKLKVEPSSSMPLPLRNMKTDAGLSSGTTRLTSFRLPRDLTLGGNIKAEKPKKVYTPNLNAQRNKKKDDLPQPKNEKRKVESPRGRGRGRGNMRGRGKIPNNHIQSSGIFSEGASNPEHKRYGGSRDSDRSYGKSAQKSTSLEKPKLDLNRTIDQDEEKRKIKSLLRDDFIDDGVEINLDNAPVMLPLIEETKLYKEEPKKETETEDDTEVDRKPVILETGEAISPKKEESKPTPQSHMKYNLSNTVPQIIENKTNSYILIQFPDCLPGFESSGESAPTTRHPNEPHVDRKTDNKPTKEFCTLNSLKSGVLGKLQILKSGKARLCLGENNLIVDVGSMLSFRQDLIAAKLDTVKLTGELINLGPVTNTLICSPDWESMLAKL